MSPHHPSYAFGHYSSAAPRHVLRRVCVLQAALQGDYTGAAHSAALSASNAAGSASNALTDTSAPTNITVPVYTAPAPSAENINAPIPQTLTAITAAAGPVDPAVAQAAAPTTQVIAGPVSAPSPPPPVPSGPQAAFSPPPVAASPEAGSPDGSSSAAGRK